MFKTKKLSKKILTCLLFIIFLLILPISAHAAQASLSLSPITGGPHKVGSTFSVSIWAKTGGNKIDTIRASLTFPANLLEVQSVSLSSAYNAPAGGNTYDNNTGTIYWGGGAYGGTTQDAVFATIVFKAKANGTAKVNFASNSLMLSAGQNIPFTTAGGTYTLGEEEAPAPSPVQPVTPQPTLQQPTPIPAQELSITNTITNIIEEKGKPPVFLGKTNVDNAIINFDIDNGLFTDSTQTDAEGNWKINIPEELMPGTYTIKITAVHPQNSTVTSTIEKDFEIVITEALETLFDVILNIDQKSKKIKAGEDLLLHVKLLNFGENVTPDSTVNVTFDYIIENADREKIAKFTEKRKVRGRESSFDKKISTPQNISPGQYFVFAKMTYGKNQEASSSDGFEIIQPLSAVMWTIIISLIVLIIIGIIYYYVAWKKKPKKV